MSKSVGNVINPLDLIDELDEDSVRFFLMRDMKLGQDSNFSEESFITRYNSDLANDLEILLSRITNLINKFLEENYLQVLINHQEENSSG